MNFGSRSPALAFVSYPCFPVRSWTDMNEAVRSPDNGVRFVLQLLQNIGLSPGIIVALGLLRRQQINEEVNECQA